MKKKQIDSFRVFSILVVRIVFICYFGFSVVKIVTDFRTTSLLQIILFGIYLITLKKAIIRQGPLSISALFLYSFFLFLLSRVFLDFINVSNMYISDRFAWYTISEETTITILISYILFLVVLYIYVSIINNSCQKNYGHSKFCFSSLAKLEKITETILMVLLPVSIIYEVYCARTEDYMNMFRFDDRLPTVLALITYFAEFTIPIYFCSLPQGKRKKMVLILIFTFYLAESLRGQRSVILLASIFMIWYELSIGKKLRVGKALGIISALAVLTVLLTFIRESSAYFSNQNIVVKMLNSAGGTHMMFANFIDYRDKLINDTPLYFLSGIIQPINRYIVNPAAFEQGRNVVLAATSFSLDHKLTYALSPSAFEAGRGFGSSLIAEMWACGGFIGVIIIGFIYLLIIRFVEKRSYCNRIWFIIQFYLIQNVIWSPRGTLFPNSIICAISVIIYLLLSQIIYRKVKIK